MRLLCVSLISKTAPLRALFAPFVALVATLFMVTVESTAHAAPRALCSFEHSNASLTREGLIYLRYSLGIRDNAALVARTGFLTVHGTAAQEAINCTTCQPQLDINGSGSFDMTDAIIVSRRLAGFSGADLTAGLSLGTGSRNTQALIESFINNGCPDPNPVVVLAAGDIADCPTPTGAVQTLALLRNTPGVPVLTLGDNVYDVGSLTEFNDCFAPTWGTEMPRLRPSPGNHDYGIANATGYYSYFGANAGLNRTGYYSFDVGNWHFISLNSNIASTAGSPQELWLRNDLANTTRQCILAYWHHPRFSSSATHGSNTKMQPIWSTLMQYGATLVLSGHVHNYERFAKQNATGVADPTNGIRGFNIGTGGVGLYSMGSAIANSEFRNDSTYGIFKLTLGASNYSWQFIDTNSNVIDSGSANCNTRPSL
jgi:hypothetical protein